MNNFKVILSKLYKSFFYVCILLVLISGFVEGYNFLAISHKSYLIDSKIEELIIDKKNFEFMDRPCRKLSSDECKELNNLEIEMTENEINCLKGTGGSCEVHENLEKLKSQFLPMHRNFEQEESSWKLTLGCLALLIIVVSLSKWMKWVFLKVEK